MKSSNTFIPELLVSIESRTEESSSDISINRLVEGFSKMPFNSVSCA